MHNTNKAAETYISSNMLDHATWHVARVEEIRSQKSGKLFGVSYRALCNGRVLGGPCGFSKTTQRPDNLCARCMRLVQLSSD